MSTHAALRCYKNSVSEKEENKFLTLLEPLRWRVSCRSAFSTSPDLATRSGDPNPPSCSALPSGVSSLTAFPLPISILTGFGCFTLKRTERVVKEKCGDGRAARERPGRCVYTPCCPGCRPSPCSLSPAPALAKNCSVLFLSEGFVPPASPRHRSNVSVRPTQLKQSLGPLGPCVTSEQQFVTVDVRQGRAPMCNETLASKVKCSSAMWTAAGEQKKGAALIVFSSFTHLYSWISWSRQQFWYNLLADYTWNR